MRFESELIDVINKLSAELEAGTILITDLIVGVSDFGDRKTYRIETVKRVAHK